jgi:hypothetical protein
MEANGTAKPAAICEDHLRAGVPYICDGDVARRAGSVTSGLDDDLAGHWKSQAPSVKYQTNNKSETIKQQTTVRTAQGVSVWRFRYCRLRFVCDLVLAIWCFALAHKIEQLLDRPLG